MPYSLRGLSPGEGEVAVADERGKRVLLDTEEVPAAEDGIVVERPMYEVDVREERLSQWAKDGHVRCNVVPLDREMTVRGEERGTLTPMGRVRGVWGVRGVR